jgi:tetratricopeptide (TPR) repeat protein
VSLGLCGLFATSCAPKTAPPVVTTPRHADFVFPQAGAGTPAALAARLENGWRYLQVDDLRNAEREFAMALKTRPGFYPAEAALGYLALARASPRDAVTRFDRVLQAEAGYVPALVGRGQALLALDRPSDALASFELALARDPTLVGLRGRVDVLKFRALQERIATARAAAEAGRPDEARDAYEQAIAASPESPFLYRDLAGVEQKAGRVASALAHYRKAVELDGSDVRSLSAIGAILEAQGDLAGALDAYERARAVDASEVSASAIERLRDALALAKLPAEYRAIPNKQTVTRADVAALVGYRLDAVLARASPRPTIMTDIRAHWAQSWITAAVRAGVMDPLPNYQFDPSGRVRRNDLALIVSRVLELIEMEQPRLAASWQDARVTVADVPPDHLSYPAVSAAVAAGVMPLSGGVFGLLRDVTGSEAIDVVTRLERLARR